MKRVPGGRLSVARRTIFVLVAVVGLVAVTVPSGPILAQEAGAIRDSQTPESNYSDAIHPEDSEMDPQKTESPERNPAESSASRFSRLADKAEREGTVRVIVGLRTDYMREGRLNPAQRADQHRRIKNVRSKLQTALDHSGYRTLRQYDTLPAVALEVSPQALEKLRRSPLVTDVAEDLALTVSQVESTNQSLAESSGMNLAQSTSIVQAPAMWNEGFTGQGQVIAVVDTGVDSSHWFLDGKVVEEACFTSESEKGPDGTGDCPDGTRTQYGEGSAVPCTFDQYECAHGTHVAGIAAGQDPFGDGLNSGVAKGANIMSVQVFSNCADAGQDPCSVSYASDQMKALEHVYELRHAHDFAAVNLSIGAGPYSSRCDDAEPRYKAAIDNLKDAGIATVVASGNDSFKDQISFPACISSAVSVGATTASDAIWDDLLSGYGSNSASFLSLLAPGEAIGSSVPDDGFEARSGTSMAAPHVAGAWALIKQKSPGASVDSIRWSLQGSGTLVTDRRSSIDYPTGTGITKPRINIADAAKTGGTAEVTNTNASGDGSLRQAITEANTDAKADIIRISATGTVELQSALPDLVTDVEIIGPGAERLTVKRSGVPGTPKFRIFTVGEGATVSISGLTMTNGDALDCRKPSYGNPPCGGGIANYNGTLTVEGSTISGNTAYSTFVGEGGGIYNLGGTLTVEGSTISGNYGLSGVSSENGTLTVEGSTISGNHNGGIRSDNGTLTVEGSTIRRNTSDGGIWNSGGELTVEDSTISENTSSVVGGGIRSDGGNATKSTIINTTISGNSAYDRGGGVENGSGLTTIEYSTITNNTARLDGDGVASDTYTTTRVSSSIIAGNKDPNGNFGDVYSEWLGSTNNFVSGGNNLVGDGNATGAFVQPGDQTNVSARQAFGTDTPWLAGNGGPTQTIALRADSIAIDRILSGTNGCGEVIQTDQRGAARKSVDGGGGGVCDTGAFEFSPELIQLAAEDDSYSTDENQVLNVEAPGVLGNDENFEGGALEAVREESPSNGTLDLDSNGSFTYTPNAGFTGEDTFIYRASDGTSSSNIATVTITVEADKDPPDTALTSFPKKFTRSTTAAFRFSSPDSDVARFQCKLDGASYRACASPKSYSGLAGGRHTFRVRAVDSAGNIDPTPAEIAFQVDTVKPTGVITIRGGTNVTPTRRVKLTLSASDPSPASGVSLMRFRNENTRTWSAWRDYATTTYWRLSSGAGTKTVYVQYRDQAGNLSAAYKDAIKYNP